MLATLKRMISLGYFGIALLSAFVSALSLGWLMERFNVGGDFGRCSPLDTSDIFTDRTAQLSLMTRWLCTNVRPLIYLYLQENNHFIFVIVPLALACIAFWLGMKFRWARILCAALIGSTFFFGLMSYRLEGLYG